MLNKFYPSLKQKHYCYCFKGHFYEMRKSIPSTGAHPYTRVQGSSLYTKADKLHNSTKVKPKLVLTDSTCKGSPHLPNSCPPKLHRSHLCRHVLRQDGRTPMHQSMQDFLSTLPSHLRNAASLPKGKCQVWQEVQICFPGNLPFPNPQNSLASLVTCTGNGVKWGESFIIS